MAGELFQPAGKVFEVILPLREEDWRTALFEGLNDVVEDEPVAPLVGRQ